MYESFIKENKAIPKIIEESTDFIKNLDKDIISLLDECGRRSFKDGLYKVHTPNSSFHWALLVSRYFPEYNGKIVPFGYDWMERQFALHSERKNIILMFDPSTAEDFELVQDFISQ
jgi:hypothetical protein